ncbi:thioether cross-link-forming SCIFF peptide maturase [Oscillospiraceae bacterium MB08-C2-2]|nr:thioether cross-link-forming SCIFF peptide maturase [Oscillospiraceae bacterium MB08-C2-2]
MIHQYCLDGHYIVLDVNSGAIHTVDKLVYDLLEKLVPPLGPSCPLEVLQALEGKYPPEELAEAYEDIFALYEAGQLFSVDDYGPYADRMVASPIKAMCLNVSHDCNLRCEYCFAGKGDYSGGRMLMPVEIGKKAVDLLIEKSQGRRNLELDFFGGEPLMNFQMVKEVVAYAREQEKIHGKNFRFTITTNGMLLDESKMDFINAEMSNVVLSIDGRKEVNDRVRARVNGSGCYDAIMPKFQRLVEKRDHDRYYVRGTFTKYNLDFSKDVESLHAAGFDQISVEPVAANPALPYAITREDLPRIFEEYEILARKILASKEEGKGYNFFHFMLDLDQGPCAIKRLRGCGCGNEYIAVTPDGDIYPCHQFIGHDQWKMGSLLDGTLDLDMKERFSKTSVYQKQDCQQCWAKFYCSGGCNANNMQYEGDILKSYDIACQMEKKRLECAIMIKAALAEA